MLELFLCVIIKILIYKYKYMAKVGRPMKFRTKADLVGKIAEYRAFILKYKKPMTLERLACFLGCTSETLRDYGKNKEEFSSTIKELREEIKADKIERLIEGKGSAAGLIFDLKNNHGMKDKQVIDQNITGEVSLGKAFEGKD